MVPYQLPIRRTIMMQISKLACAALSAGIIAVPAAALAGGLSLSDVQNAFLAQRQAHGITFDSIAKEVQPGIFEVDPKGATGRRIVFSPTAPPPQLICFGRWGGAVCRGILMDMRPQPPPATPTPAAQQ
jgi:hypothetical protein